MIPLNEYPKEELEDLLNAVYAASIKSNNNAEFYRWPKWVDRIKEAISDQEFKEKELPFKTEDNESREFEL